MSDKLVWTAEAEQRLKKIPFFVRGFAKRRIERHAKINGVTIVDEHLIDQVKSKEMPSQ